MMDGWVSVLRPFNSISVTSRRWKDEHEKLCAMKRRLGSGRISPPAGFEPATPWPEVGSANRPATRTLLSFPNETSSVLHWSYCKKTTALGGRLVSCHISIQRIKFELHAGALPICYPRPYKYVLFYRNSRNIAFRTVNVLAFHKTLWLKDSCSNSDCFRDWARYGSPSTCNPSHAT